VLLVLLSSCYKKRILRGTKMLSNNLIKKEIDAKSSRFIEDIVNGMYDWVRVMDLSDNIIYANKAMCDGLGFDPKGKKCFSVLGRAEPCVNCISQKAIISGVPQHKEEVIAGKHYSVTSSPLLDHEGKIFAVVEVLRDVTSTIEMQTKIINQNKVLQNDLEIARKLQISLLPKNLPNNKIESAFVYMPCDNLGGDFLDIYPIDDNHTGIYIADVSGHGVSASMLTVFLRSTILKNTLSPSKALTDLYKKFNSYGFDQDLYITLF
jgi:sigma-B regulation protein RsbU (phosphoserine phosphatase)